jgi:hypothetical protein
MRIYVFKSETRKELRAFAADPRGDLLPRQHGPWTATGVTAEDRAPPHGFSRSDIENAPESSGFQL